ncbi:leucine-rich repeat extensin-like protein 1 [Nicotiana sylvestris]|uniref:leucine-rich repeat extensin-like protein 1 n=1 Tax=Nicotiana sylvestris TaxID=4096 RepID=UPI00388CB973
MASKDLDTRVIDPSREIEKSESELKEEVQRLKQQMAEMHQSWVRRHPPPSFPTNYTENLATIPPLSQAQVPTTIDLSPQHALGFIPYHNYPGTSSQMFHAPPAKTTSYPTPASAPIFVAPPPATLPRSSSETVFKVPDAQGKRPRESFREFWFRWNEQVARVSSPIGRKDVAEPCQRQNLVSIPAKCFQPQYRPHKYSHTPDNPPQCYFPPQNSQSHTSPPQYSIHNSPPYAPHSQKPQQLAPPPQISYPPQRAYQPFTRKRFPPRSEYKMRRQ